MHQGMLRGRAVNVAVSLIGLFALVFAVLIPTAAHAAQRYKITTPDTGLYTYSGGDFDTPFDDLADGVSGNNRGHIGPIYLEPESGDGPKIAAFCVDMERGVGEHYDPTSTDIDTVASSSDRRRISYIIWKWGKRTNNIDAAAAQIAIWKYTDSVYFADGDTNVEANDLIVEKIYGTLLNGPEFSEQDLQQLKAKATEILKDAEANAVDAVSVKPVVVKTPKFGDGKAEVSAEVFGRNVGESVGEFSPGTFTGTLKLKNAKFADASDTSDDGRTRTVRNGEKHEIRIDSGAPAGTDVEIVAEFDLPFASQLTVLQATGADKPKQRVAPFIDAKTTNKSGNATFQVPGGHKWQVNVSTKTSSQKLLGPGQLTDNVSLEVMKSNDNPDARWGAGETNTFARIRLTNVLYYSETAPVEQQSVPADAEKVGEVVVDVSRPDNHGASNGHKVVVTVPEISVSKPGYYTWVSTVAGSGSKAEDELFTSTTTAWGIADETTLLEAEPPVSTQPPVGESLVPVPSDVPDTYGRPDPQDPGEHHDLAQTGASVGALAIAALLTGAGAFGLWTRSRR